MEEKGKQNNKGTQADIHCVSLPVADYIKIAGPMQAGVQKHLADYPNLAGGMVTFVFSNDEDYRFWHGRDRGQRNESEEMADYQGRLGTPVLRVVFDRNHYFAWLKSERRVDDQKAKGEYFLFWTRVLAQAMHRRKGSSEGILQFLHKPEAARWKLTPAQQAQLNGLMGRYKVPFDAERWGEALEVLSEINRLFPEELAGWIDLAYCLSRLDRVKEARDHLLQGVDKFPRSLLMRFNLATYEFQLGELEEAKRWLKASHYPECYAPPIETVAADPAVLEMMSDPDYQKMRASFYDFCEALAQAEGLSAPASE